MSNISSTMQALALHAVGDLRLERRAVRNPDRGEVMVRVHSCGVCGSDLPRIFHKGTYHFPTVCGHEFAGTVAQAGEEVDDFKVGDRVAVFPLLWCRRCASCERGQYVHCENYNYLGSRCDGGFAEYVIAPRQNLLRLPDSISLEEAAMTEPAAVALHAIKRIGRPIVGLSVGIWGAGPIGLMVAQWARAMGASSISIFDLAPAKLELARSLGVNHALDPRQPQNTRQEFDLCIDAAGVPAATNHAARTAGRDGHVVLLGNPSGDIVLPTDLVSQVMRREITLHGTWNSSYSTHGGDDWRAAIDAMARRSLSLLPLVSHRVPLSGAADLLRQMRQNGDAFVKVLIQP